MKNDSKDFGKCRGFDLLIIFLESEGLFTWQGCQISFQVVKSQLVCSAFYVDYVMRSRKLISNKITL